MEAGDDEVSSGQGPGWLMDEAEMHTWVGKSEGMIKIDEQTGKCQYYCDRNRKWPFEATRFGCELLCDLNRTNVAPLTECQKLIVGTGDPGCESRGMQIYSEKKHLNGPGGVTWSHEEYGHPGFQKVYLKMKSFQRFTETWALLERAARNGLFHIHDYDRRRVRAVSVGGGPGYELLAFDRFFRCHVKPEWKEGDIELISLDLQPLWKVYVESMNMSFDTWDINDGFLLDKIRQPNALPASDNDCITYVIISYVMIYVTNAQTCNMLADLLRQPGVHCILVSERGEETKCLRMMEERGIKVTRLMNQSNGLDERQSMWLLPSTPTRPMNKRIEVTFPNQPFEEHKTRGNGRKWGR